MAQNTPCKMVRLSFHTTKRLEMLLELAEDNALLGSMSYQTRYYSPSEALHMLEFISADVRAFTWFLDEAHSINLICSYETEDVREPLISTEHEALAALHWLADEIAKEEHP